MENIRGFSSKALAKVDELTHENKTLAESKEKIESNLTDVQGQLVKQQTQYSKLIMTHFVTKFELDRQYMKQHGDTNRYHALLSGILSPDKNIAISRSKQKPDTKNMFSAMLSGQKEEGNKAALLTKSDVKEPGDKKDELSALSFSQAFSHKNVDSQQRIANLLSGQSPIKKEVLNRRDRINKKP